MSAARIATPEPRRMEKDGFRLGSWVVRPELNEITSEEGSRRLQHTEMRLLVFLAENAGRDLARAEIVRGVWGEGFHSPEVLTVAVSKLRKAMDDDSRRPSLIKTVPRLGYRMIEIPEALDAPRSPGTTKGSPLARWVGRAGPRFLVISSLFFLLLVAVILQVVVEIVARI